MAAVSSLIRRASLVFWDFDGVIKESLDVKADAFERLFLPYGEHVAQRVRQHHQTNGGMSRFEKIPLYLAWAGEPVTDARVAAFCARFGDAVRQAVIDSSWVPGVERYLRDHASDQAFVVVSATPQDELAVILDALALGGCFREVHGAPLPKAVAIRDVLARHRLTPADALVVGDSESDLDAAAANDVPFLLRRTPLNDGLQRRYTGPSFDGLDG